MVLYIHIWHISTGHDNDIHTYEAASHSCPFNTSLLSARRGGACARFAVPIFKSPGKERATTHHCRIQERLLSTTKWIVTGRTVWYLDGRWCWKLQRMCFPTPTRRLNSKHVDYSLLQQTKWLKGAVWDTVWFGLLLWVVYWKTVR